MKHVSNVFVLALSVAAATVVAHDLKTELQALVPAGQTLRLVYAKGGAPQEDNGWGNFNFPGTAVYAVSSADGIIKKIYPAGTATGNYHCINITNDGRRVVFWDAAANQVVVVGFDGSSPTKITPNGYSANAMYDYYYDAATNTDWAVMSDDNTFKKVNIDQPTVAPVVVLTSAQKGGWYPGDDVGGTVSDDGKWMVGDDGNGVKGLIDLTKATRTFVKGRSGCHPIMRAGTPVHFSQNDGDNKGENCTTSGSDHHRGPTVMNTSGQTVETYCVSDVMTAFVNANSSFKNCFTDRADGLRWLRHHDYFSGMIYGNFGPILWRTTDKKWTYIEHDVACNTYIGDMDGQIAQFTAVQQDRKLVMARSLRQGAEARMYSLDGRLLAQPAHGDQIRAGVVIKQAAHGAVVRVYR